MFEWVANYVFKIFFFLDLFFNFENIILNNFGIFVEQNYLIKIFFLS